MTVGTLLSRVTGVVRTIAMAHAFGLFVLADAYNQANQTPTMVYELVVGGILAATLVPVFVRQFTKDNDEEAWRAVSAIFTEVGVVVVFLSFVVAAAAPWIIDVYTSGNQSALAGEQRETASYLLRIFAPQVAIYGFISVTTGLLNARRRFGAPMFAPIFNNLILIVLFLSLPSIAGDLASATVDSDRRTITILGLGTSLGVLAMALAILPSLRKEAAGRLTLRWEPKHPAVKTVVRLSGWTAGFVVTNQIALAVNLILAGTNVGDTTAWLTAYTFFILPHGIYAVSVMNALAPNLSEAWAKHDTADYRATFVTGIRLILFIVVPASIGYAMLSGPVVDLVLRHGEFDQRAADVTASVLLGMVIGLPGFSAFIFSTRALQATQDARAVFYLYLFENAINVAAAYPLYQAFGVKGLAYAQSIAYLIGAVAAIAIVRKRGGGLMTKKFIDGLARIIAASAVMALCLAIVEHFIDGALASVLIGVFVGALAYGASAWIFRIDELRRIARRPRRATTQ